MEKPEEQFIKALDSIQDINNLSVNNGATDSPFNRFLDAVRSHKLKHHFEWGEDNTTISVLDRLTPDKDSDISRGLEETELLADELWNTHVLPLHEELKSTVDEKWEVISDADKTIKQLQAENKLLREEIERLKAEPIRVGPPVPRCSFTACHWPKCDCNKF